MSVDIGYEEIGDDLLGDDDLSGDDLLGDDLLGAAPRRMMARRANFGRQGAGVVRQREAMRARAYVMGVDSVTTIAAAASSNITSRPQVTFRPDRLVVPATIAPSFLITDFKIGKNSQLAAGAALPAEAFAQNAVAVSLKLDTAQISQDVTLSVTNVSGGALRFTAALIGPAIE